MCVQPYIVNQGSCQHSCRPEVIDLSRVYNFIKWNVPDCSNGLQVQQYHIWFADIMSQLHYLTNLTSTYSSCAIANGTVCYFRVRAELDDGSVSSYSACLHISNQINENKSIMDIIVVTFLINIIFFQFPLRDSKTHAFK